MSHMDDLLYITEDWLERSGFQRRGTYMGTLIPCQAGSVVELSLTPDERGWVASLLQDDDHVTITSKVFATRCEVRMLMAALGVVPEGSE